MDTKPSAKRRKTYLPPNQTSLTKFFVPTRESTSISKEEEDVLCAKQFSSPSPAAMGTEHSPSSSRDTTISPTPPRDPIPPWSGCPLNELSFGPSAYPVLPPLLPSPTHAILFRSKLGLPPIPFPEHFRDVWDQYHVRMPCSRQSLYPVEGGELVGRWDLIKKAFGKEIANSHDFETAVLSYNSHYAERWSFKGLHVYFEEICSDEQGEMFFSVLLPRIVRLALSLPEVVTHAVPLLKRQQNYSVTLSQQQIACLLANAFLCTFPRRNSAQSKSEYASYPFINFNKLFATNVRNSISQDRENKLRCLFHYFTRVTTSMPDGVLTFQRQVLEDPPQWGMSQTPLRRLHVTSQGTIENNGHGMLQVDFANKYLGGGVLGRGCVQEEIRFLVCPELLTSLLFTEKLEDNECLIMTGSERYSNYRGYASSFEWSGSHRESTARDSWRRVQTRVVAIDAINFHSKAAQFKPENILRELNKAYCGFLDNDYTSASGQSMAVATGNWGCGAFGGDARLKSMLQLMAASEAGRGVVYFTFGDQGLQQDMASLYTMLTQNSVTIAQLWGALVSYSEYRTRRDRPALYPFLHTTLATISPPPPPTPSLTDDSAPHSPSLTDVHPPHSPYTAPTDSNTSIEPST